MDINQFTELLNQEKKENRQLSDIKVLLKKLLNKSYYKDVSGISEGSVESYRPYKHIEDNDY